MKDVLYQTLKDHILSTQQRLIPFPPANPQDVDETEQGLGFEIPESLKLVYLIVGNGGFGPGKGGRIIGLNRGYESELGTIVSAYHEIRRGADYLGLQWLPTLLPFCAWGCNIFSCVDCDPTSLQIYLSETCDARAQGFSLDEFLTMWIEDKDILGNVRPVKETKEGVNPFNGKKIRFFGRPNKERF